LGSGGERSFDILKRVISKLRCCYSNVCSFVIDDVLTGTLVLRNYCGIVRAVDRDFFCDTANVGDYDLTVSGGT
jgi:hypothetical protein